ncbi:hypothetical protein A2765_00540 [Candidatus Kaiserbacteria bacterium RIFCSPHIGHO2_01_FULL_56_24]|uniref:2'-5' RNA ligase n=1 Tax=Candidatus Kaiserbacteria bacterium RIFCSPHIGHO2_01_FULL_56_24 TaxID=1798487 RepID=A0A1F6DBQ6_9BACT|nr:MAG: hypothetical protein A2765_00540 [Candidatus Kaiserbacteria bacterium RIFCSPHIGHO2_01_FULL_56_24]
MRIDIVLLPSKKVSDALGGISASLHRKIPMVFCVDNKKLLPHVSLYHLNVRQQQLNSLSNTVSKLAHKRKAIPVRITGSTKGKNWFSLNINKPRALTLLHTDVVKTCKKFHDGPMRWPTPITTRQERAYVKKYGAPNVLKNFSPHFTLGWTKREKDLKRIVDELKKMESRELDIQRIAIAEVDVHCQVFRIIKELKLK